MYGKDKRDGLSKEGSGRVAVYKMTNMTYVYTLECNYNTGRIVNRLVPPHVPKEFSKAAVSPPPPPLKAVSPKYTPECWRSVGKALALSALDIVGANPCSRLGSPAGGGYARLRATVSAWCKNYAKKEAKRKPVNRGGGSDEDDDEEGGEEEGEEDADEEDEEEEGGEEAADDVELRLGYGAVGVGGLLAAGRGVASAAAASAAAASAAAASAAAAQEPQGPLQDLSAADDLVGRFRNRFHLEGDDDDDAVQPPPAVAPALGAHTPLLGAAEPLPHWPDAGAGRRVGASSALARAFQVATEQPAALTLAVATPQRARLTASVGPALTGVGRRKDREGATHELSG